MAPLVAPSFLDTATAKQSKICRIHSDTSQGVDEVVYHVFNKETAAERSLKGFELEEELSTLLSQPSNPESADLQPEAKAKSSSHWFHTSIDDKRSLGTLGTTLGIRVEHYTNVDSLGWQAEYVCGATPQQNYLRIVVHQLKFAYDRPERTCATQVVQLGSGDEISSEPRDVADDLSLQEVLLMIFFFPSHGILVTVGATAHLSPILNAAKRLLRNQRSVLRQAWPSAGGGVCSLIVVMLDALMDMVDPILDTYGDAIEGLYLINAKTPHSHHVFLAHKLESSLHEIRRSCWDARGVCIELKQNYSGVLENEGLLQVIIRATVQLERQIECYSSQCKTIEHAFSRYQDTRMNRTMSILTNMSIVFLPLQAMSGLWGMNFQDTMLELSWEYGYLLFWVLSLIWLLLAIVWIFRIMM